MLDVWRNLLRRKVRTSLTILGIVIGVLALTVMGSLAERMNQMVSGALSYYGTRIVVLDAQSPRFIAAVRPLSLDYIPRLEAVAGVEAALPTVFMFLETEPESFSLGPPSLIRGVPPGWSKYDVEPLALAQGRHLSDGERGVVVLGMDLAVKKGAEVGDRVALRGREFQVVGVWDRTMTAPDNMAAMPLADAQELFVASLPPLLRPQTSELATAIEVFPKKGADFNQVAEEINHTVDGVKAQSPREFQEEVRRAMVVFNALILGGAIIALVVGGLAVINTMAMAVSERTREIGVKKAVGASTGHILREYLAEAASIGFLGGLVGLGLGTVAVSLLNKLAASQGVALFAVTPRLALGAVAFATFLGLVGGLYPALRAARLDPVAALRSE